MLSLAWLSRWCGHRGPLVVPPSVQSQRKSLVRKQPKGEIHASLSPVPGGREATQQPRPRDSRRRGRTVGGGGDGGGWGCACVVARAGGPTVQHHASGSPTCISLRESPRERQQRTKALLDACHIHLCSYVCVCCVVRACSPLLPVRAAVRSKRAPASLRRTSIDTNA